MGIVKMKGTLPKCPILDLHHTQMSISNFASITKSQPKYHFINATLHIGKCSNKNLGAAWYQKYRIAYLCLKITDVSFANNMNMGHYNEGDGVSNHQPHDCFLNCLFRRRSKKTVTGEFPAQRACNAKNVSTWWSHHVIGWCTTFSVICHALRAAPSSALDNV